MNIVLEKIKNKLNQLNIELEDAIEEEKKMEDVCENLLFECKISSDIYQFSCDQIMKFNDKIENKKIKYANNKCFKHMCITSFITMLISLCIAVFNIKIGMITDSFFAIMGCVALGGIAGLIDITLFWDKVKNKSYNEFEELESTKRSRAISDKLYAEKLKSEKELKNFQSKLDYNKKMLNIAKGKRRLLQKQINNLKTDTFDNLLQLDVKDSDIKLILK